MSAPAVEAAAPMETTTVETASETRLPAGGKTSDISAVIEAAERAGMHSSLNVGSRRPVKTRIPGAASVK